MASEELSGSTETIWKTKENKLFRLELFGTDELDFGEKFPVTLRNAAVHCEIVTAGPRQQVQCKELPQMRV